MKAIFKQKILHIQVIEWLLILIIFLTIGFLFAKNGGGPQYSDELWYMDAGINDIKDIISMNYYFHIYLQKPFLELASRPVEGAKLYWSFLVTVSGSLVYLCIRWMNKSNTVLHGFIGVLIFYSVGIFPRWAGVTKVDFTSMMTTTLCVAAYVLAIKEVINKRIAFFLIGLFLFLCLKSKETTIFIAVILFGLGYTDNERFSWKALFDGMKYCLSGIVAGTGVFMILSAIVLKDPFWGIRITDWINYFKIKFGIVQPVSTPLNWYVEGIATTILIPFTLYIISGINLRHHDTPIAERLLWLYPLLLLVFLTIAFLTNGYKTESRFILPAIPLICILAMHAYEFNFEITKRQFYKLFGVLILSTGIAIGMILVFDKIQIHKGWEWVDYFYSMVIPLAFSILLGFKFLMRRRRLINMTILLVCLLLIFLPLTINNFITIIIDKPNHHRLSQMYYPYAAFSKDIEYTENMRMYVSPTIPAHLQMLMMRREEIRSMFDIYFDVYTEMDNFIFPATYNISTGDYIYKDPMISISKMDYDQAIIAFEDWRLLETTPLDFQAVQEKYEYKIDSLDLLVYLSKR